MEVARDASALVFHGPLLLNPLEPRPITPPFYQPDASRNQTNQDESRERLEPLRLPEIRLSHDRHARARFIPRVVEVACLDAKTIIPRWNMAVTRHAYFPSFSPTKIQPFQLISKPNFFRRCKTDAGKMKFQAVAAWRNRQNGTARTINRTSRTVQWHILVFLLVHPDILHQRDGQGGDMGLPARINGDNPRRS